MSKQEFLAQLHKGLRSLPREDAEERLTFYSEMIDDRMEEGLSEEEAVAAVGSAEGIAAQITGEALPAKKKKERRRWKAWEIVLLAVGSPIWLSLLIAAFAVAVSLYAVVWCVVISLWAVFASLAGCAFAGIAAGVFLALEGNGLTGLAVAGAGMVCGGLAVFLFFGCRGATKGTVLLTKKIVLGIGNCFA